MIDPMGLMSDTRPKQIIDWQQGQSVERVFTEQMEHLQGARRALVDQMNSGDYKIGTEAVEALITLMHEERSLIGAMIAGTNASDPNKGSGNMQVNILPSPQNSGPVIGARLLPSTINATSMP